MAALSLRNVLNVIGLSPLGVFVLYALFATMLIFSGLFLVAALRAESSRPSASLRLPPPLSFSLLLSPALSWSLLLSTSLSFSLLLSTSLSFSLARSLARALSLLRSRSLARARSLSRAHSLLSRARALSLTLLDEQAVLVPEYLLRHLLVFYGVPRYGHRQRHSGLCGCVWVCGCLSVCLCVCGCLGACVSVFVSFSLYVCVCVWSVCLTHAFWQLTCFMWYRGC